jgi:phosphoadenosine phosphosulfate reductase
MEIYLPKTMDFCLPKSIEYSLPLTYIVDGVKLNISRSEFFERNTIELSDEYANRMGEINYEEYNKIIDRFIVLNKSWLEKIKMEAIEDIQRVSKDYNDGEMFISFSGGKDSTVIDDLVKKALLHRKVNKIFGDTTLEFPSTYEYIARTKENVYNREYSKVLTATNRRDDFYDLCESIGPPSRVLRWCCMYFKTTPISDKIDRMFSEKNKVLAFHGIRRSESISRSKYDMETDSPKISKQRVFAPIIDWSDFDVWLHILSSKIDFNDAYRYGYARVGCWNCPNNGNYDMFLSKIYFPEMSEKLHKMLMDFAIKTNKEDPEGYVNGNFWKARQGGNGLEFAENAIINYQPCAIENNSFNYQLSRPITKEFYNLFIPFGKVDFKTGNKHKGEVYILSKDGIPCMRMQGKIGTDLLKVTVLDIKGFGGISKKIKNVSDAKKKIECQIAKYQTCIACKGCKSVCKYDAINIISKKVEDELTGNIEFEVEYTIDEKKCIKCGECIDHFGSGCYMKKILRTKQGA